VIFIKIFNGLTNILRFFINAHTDFAIIKSDIARLKEDVEYIYRRIDKLEGRIDLIYELLLELKNKK